MRIQTLALACTLAVMSTLVVQAQDTKAQDAKGQEKKKAEPAPAPTSKKSEMTTKQKASYGIGISVGRNLARQGLSADVLDVDALTRGILQALAGKESVLTEDELNAAYEELQAAMNAKAAAKATANAEAGKKFLAANAKKSGIKTTKSGLQYEVIKAGKGPTPTKNDRVSTHYKGQLISGKVFDGSYKGKVPVPTDKPISFGVGGVIAGWTEALQLMKVGDKWRLFIPSELAYGKRGSPGGIGPDETLIFEIELIAIE